MAPPSTDCFHDHAGEKSFSAIRGVEMEERGSVPLRQVGIGRKGKESSDMLAHIGEGVHATNRCGRRT